jgi:hypothetical protein
MADIFENGLLTGVAGDNALGATTGSVRDGDNLSTGALRRKFNFGDRVSELNLSQDPFFRFVSKVSKQATDDPAFKFTEKRGSWMKRYAYVTNYSATSGALALAGTDAAIGSGGVDAGDTAYFAMATDYKSEGNIQNVQGNSNADITVGVAGTQPQFFLPGQLVKIPYNTTKAATSWDDSSATVSSAAEGYLVCKIESVDNSSYSTHSVIKTKIVKGESAALELTSFSDHNSSLAAVDISSFSIADYLEPKRCYVVGSAHSEGSGYPETWKDQPYGTGYGQTQIWKTAMAMTNTMRATSLKYEQNEWSRIWREKLIEHKYDIEQSLLFGSQYVDADGVQYTQGAVDFVVNYGNKFSLDVNTKTADDFLDDMSGYMDPRYNNASGTVFFCSTAVFNWLHKLGGFFKNNLEVSSNYRADMAITGKKKVMGIDITTISTPYGDMNVARNIHLDGTNIKLLGINMSNCKYRPLVGNGLNRDTSVYVGVQTLENSGIDRRVDLILTEAGMQWEMPESHAVWTA